MWIRLGLVRTLAVLLVYSVFGESINNGNSKKYNVVTVKRIRIRPNSASVSYQNNTKSYLDKLSPERRARCRRYSYQYYGQYNQDLPVYNYPEYSTGYYTPSRCYTYCLECPTSSCRRRCPPPTVSSQGIQAQIIISSPDATKFPTKPIISACNCDPNGSKYSSCDPTTGNCICKTHYEGRTCDSCKPGYWKTLKKDCIKCHCNEFGALDSFCHQETGQCNCKSGVTGQNCDQCLSNYYGNVEAGCIECEPCTKKGHVCGKGGKCVCPTLTIGRECDRCTLNSWGYEFGKGCTACNCSQSGSSSLQCDRNSGICLCKVGYEGTRCDRCSFGYYGYPNCKKCFCNVVGTLETECHDGDCQCNEDGSCNCKENVAGSKCNRCKEGTFGLSKEHPKGCKECFCFGRSSHCVDTKYNWDKIRFEKGIENNEPISSDTISLPERFLGDLTASYDGYLSVNGSGGKFLVFLTGNGISLKSDISSNELRLNEKSWRVTSGPILYDCRTTLTRKCFLVVLQKVTSVVIQGQDMEIVEVLLDSAKPYIPYNRTSHSIEKCDCPPEYTGLSCQNPSQGYYRFYKSEQEISESDWIDNIIGVAKRCDCNGQSFECDPNNGYCANCANNTSGFHCESCASGYYQDFLGNCQACLCPSELDNNAESCVAKKHGFVCHCKTGYTGSKCEYCKDSYFRDIKTNKCVPCDCNAYGSRSSICNEYGFCECKHGFHGDKCNQCKNPREFIKEGVCTPCDECSQILFKEIDLLYNTLDSVADQFKDGLKPPWKVLHSLRSRYKTLSKEFNYKRNRANDILRAGNIDKLDERTQNLQDQCDILGITSNETLKQAERNYKQSSNFRDELKVIKDDIEKLIAQLRDFGKSHINAEEALKQAVSILKTMRRHTQQQINEVEAFNQPILDYCNRVAETVHNLYREPETLPCDDLAEFNVKLDEIEFMTKESEDTAAIAADQLDRNRIAMIRLKEAIMRFNDLKRVMDEDVQDVSDGIKDTREKINELELMLDAMENFDFSEWDRFETGILELEDKLPSLNDLVQRASEHGKKLKKTVEDRVRILDFNKGETAKINGSQAYSKIIDGVMEARETANRAQDILQKALKIINSSDGDSLRGRAFSEFAESDRLRHRITIMPDITNELMSKQKGVESFKGKLIDYTRTNNNLDRQVQSTENEITSKEHLVSRLHNAIKSSTDVIDSMRKIERDLPKLNISVQYDLFNQKKRYEGTRDEAEKAINKAKIDVAEAINKVNELLKRNDSIGADKVKNNQSSLDVVASKIAELRKKVLYARQTAETINVAVGLSNCSMLYTSPIPQTAVFRNMIISFKCVNCQLIKWRRTGLNIKIVNGKASLLLDDMSIITGKASMDKVEKVLLVERVGSLLRMKYEDGNRWESAQIGDAALIVEPTDIFEVGDGNRADNFTKVNKISINDHNIGMWKFAEIHGACKGQPRTTKEQEGARPFYSGIGYAKYASSTAMPQEFYFTFSLSTFDENSLVYLAQENERPTAFISLTLEDGYAKLDVRHNGGQSVEIKNLEKINDGRKHSVVLAMKHDSSRLKQYYTLEIDNNVRNNSVTHNVSLPKPHVFRIKKSLHYVGGIPPTLKLENINFKPRSFLGFIDYESKLTDKTISSGVTQKTGELQLYNAWFKGNGTLHLTFPAKRLESVFFVLRPLIANAAILDIKNLGTVTLSNNLLQINLINGEHYLVNEDMSVTNNDYNFITITINKSKIKLSVNGKTQEFTRTKTGRVFKGNQVDVSIGSMDGFHSFYGGISDIIVNSENIPFNYTTVQGFSNVEIGREKPLIHLNKPTTITLKGLSPSVINFTNTMQSTQGCATTANYATDPTAVNFGDQLDSYIRIKTNFWRKDFMFEFEFRTLHSSGMLFISVGSTSPPQYHFLELKDGMIAFHVKGKRKKIPKNWPITFQKKVNDGEWHKLKLIKKNGKKVQMWLDGEAKKALRIPRTNVQGEIFFGNVPKNYIVNRELKDKIRPFKGCINELKINGELWLLGKNTSDVLYNNIRQCFPKIEKGAYFGGDAYAIYKEGFRINKILDISFQFRTAEQNGILITVSNEANYPALSIELQSGAVVMTVDLGNGMQTNVTNNLDSNYALCNNMWHNVTAMYSSSELTVNVDGIRKIWVQNDINSLMDEIDAPLYIGGLPDNAAVGTLKTRENFKGCIKNLMIENELKDWSHMEELNSVLINSCPVVPLVNNS